MSENQPIDPYAEITNMDTNVVTRNKFAIPSLVIVLLGAALLFLTTFPGHLLAIAGVVLGHISLSQIKKRQEGGKKFAVTSLILGYITIAFGFTAYIVIAILFVILASQG